MRIDPTTGDRTVIASSSVGSGADITNPWQLILEDDGTIVYIDDGQDALVMIDPTTLVRTVISSDSVGTGVSFGYCGGLTQLTDGDFAVTKNTDGTDYIIRVDPATGDRTTLREAQWAPARL